MREKKRKEKKKRKKENEQTPEDDDDDFAMSILFVQPSQTRRFFPPLRLMISCRHFLSIELFAFSTSNENSQKKNEANEQASSAAKILSIDALDRASFSVIRKCTMADVLNAHFVHEYVKEDEEKEGKKKKKS